MSVVIIGGGIAGLAAAYELRRQQVPFVLLESSPRLGGVILSEQVDGYTLDGGPDALLLQKPDGVRLCEELGIADRLVPTKPPRLSFIQRGGVLHPLPAASVLGIPTRVGPFISTGLFSWAGKLRMGTEILQQPRASDEDESIGAFMTRHFGREATDYLAEPLLAGIHAGDVDRLSVKSLFPRFVEAERTHGSLLRAFRNTGSVRLQPDRGERPLQSNAESREPTAESQKPRPRWEGAFVSLPGGMSELIAALESVLPRENLRRNVPVVGLSRNDRRLRVDTSTGAAIEADAVVLATPAYVTARIVQPLSPPLAALCDAVPYASTATALMAFPRAAVQHPLNGSGFVVPRVERTNILAASWLSSKWPHRAPDDRVLMRAFAGGTRDPEAIERSDAELVKQSLDALRGLLGISGDPLFTRVYRWKRASAQHEVGHLARMQTIERALERLPGLFITGSGFRGVGIPDCIADGRATATALASWLTRNAAVSRLS